MTIRRTLATLAVAGLAVLLPATNALATTCVPTPGQEAIAPTYAIEAEYTRVIPATDPVLGEPPVIEPGKPAWTETIEHAAVDPVLGEPPVTDPGQPYIAPTVECWGVYQHWITGKIKTSAVDLGWGWVKIGTENVTTDPGQPYIAPTYGEPPVIEPGVPAWTEHVEHAAIDPVLGEPPVIEPGTPESSEPTWAEAAPEGEGWVATGNIRSGEGITRMTDPGQDAVEAVVCEDPEPQPEPEPEPGEDPDTEPVNPDDGQAPVQEPVVEPVVEPVAVPQAVQAPLVAPLAAEPVQDEQDSRLAETGASPWAMFGLAALLIVAGCALAPFTVRRQR